MTDEEFRIATVAALQEIRDLLRRALGPSGEPEPCSHPAQFMEDLSTLRRVGFRCQACGFEEIRDRTTGALLER